MLEQPPEELRSVWEERGVDVSRLSLRADGSIGVLDTLPTPDSGARGPADAPWITHDTFRASTEEIEELEELGRGGMGVVYLATQRSMRRDVAVKRLSSPSPRGVSALLKEAWVSGALEHPNVVPVHTLVEVDGSPSIVMKRVEGISWADVITDPAVHPAGLEVDRAWHIRVLLQVCYAIELAHSRGILHLDLKPENVMVGAFGEIYVVDWGLALGFGPTKPAWLGDVSERSGMAGTPAYMAPELASGGTELGPWTDVYLLGATLHHAVTGHARHDGQTLVAVLYGAYASEPHDYGDEVPAELGALLNRACHADRAERFGSVEALRLALEEHLEHRESASMLREAEHALDALLACDGETPELGVFETQCRFAIAQARRSWSDNPRAARVERALVTALIGKAVARGDLASAERLAAELGDDEEHDGAWRADLDELRAQHQTERAHVEALTTLSRELDVSQALVQRRQLFFALGLLWFLGNVSFGFVDRNGIVSIGYPALLLEGAALGLFFAPYAFVQRRIFFQNRVNRRIQSILILTAVATEALFLYGYSSGLPFAHALALTPLLYAFGFAAVAVAIDVRLAVGALFQLIAFAVMALTPRFAFEVLGVAGFCSAATTWKWPEPRRSDRPTPS